MVLNTAQAGSVGFTTVYANPGEIVAYGWGFLTQWEQYDSGWVDAQKQGGNLYQEDFSGNYDNWYCSLWVPAGNYDVACRLRYEDENQVMQTAFDNWADVVQVSN